VTLHRETSG